MVDEDQPVAMAGTANVHISQGGTTVEANGPLRVVVDETCFWQGRKDRPPVESDSPDVRRFMRRAVYTMKPDPPARPINPVPKPVSKRRKAATEPTHAVCPKCGGSGLLTNAWTEIGCDLCDGSGLTPILLAEIWRAEHD